GKREGGMTVWALAHVRGEPERKENVFQELQHAIDYLDHAPAGFFSVDADGNLSYLNATLAEWLDHDLAQVGSGGLKLNDIVAGGAGALLTAPPAAPGGRENWRPPLHPQNPHQRTPPPPAVPHGPARA